MDRSLRLSLVSDLREVNCVLKRLCHLLDGSSHILKRLDPDDKFYMVADLSMGYQLVAWDTSWWLVAQWFSAPL